MAKGRRGTQQLPLPSPDERPNRRGILRLVECEQEPFKIERLGSSGSWTFVANLHRVEHLGRQ